jgi:hypothetical protein
MPARRNPVAREVRSVRSALRDLDQSLDRLVRVLGTKQPTQTKPQRRKITLTPARRAALKLQGQYMGYMRGLKPRQKSKVKQVRAAKGIRAAIAAARRLAA